MQKPLALSIAACLGLAGCNAFHRSEAWSEAVRVRPAESLRDADPSHAYAARLHTAFKGQGVEHKVVVYQYRYTTRLREEAVGTRTAIVYRDDSDGRYPWWLKDERLNTPVWLPNGTLDKQVSFYLRRKAEVIETANYPAQGGSGKSALAFAKPAPTLRPVSKPEPALAVVRKKPAPKSTFSFFASKPAPAKPRKPVQVIAHQPTRVPAPVVAKAPVVRKAAPAVEPRKIVKAQEPKKLPAKPMVASAPPRKIKLPATFFSPQREVEARPGHLAPIASKGSGTPKWNPPAALENDENAVLTAPRDQHLEKLFRQKNGTEYNRFSPADRRKMQFLQQNLASRD